ncbi:MAG: ABC transporter [Epulopiscium sp. Nuni2H_MBin001]|nr:MAG: ABC transporter [Epulopiscium sp. Nuni2H_MBin001]
MIVEGSNVQIAYGENIVVDGIDIEVRKGEITTIIGPNGSGKSTVLKALTRLLDYKVGSICVDDTEIRKIDSKELAKKMGVLPQRHQAPPDFKVKDLVSFGRMPYQKWFKGSSDEDKEIVQWAMEQAGVLDLQNKSIQTCSGGQAQRVWIATVLAQKPEIMFLDEPTTYLDVAYQLETMRLVKRLNRESGIGIVMVLHDLSHALEVSDRIVILKDGVKYDEGAPKDVVTPTMMQDVYGVSCNIVFLEGRENPIIVYDEI